MIKIPKDMIISKIKEKTKLTDAQLQTKVKDKLDQLSGLISEEGALHIIANELGVKILEDPGKLQIKNVLAGMRNVEITGKVMKIFFKISLSVFLIPDIFSQACFVMVVLIL